MPYQQRHPQGLLIDVRTLADHSAMRPRHFAMVRGGDDECVVRQSEPSNGCEHGTNVLVDVADAVEVIVLVNAQLLLGQRSRRTLNCGLGGEIVRAVTARQVEVRAPRRVGSAAWSSRLPSPAPPLFRKSFRVIFLYVIVYRLLCADGYFA